MPKRRAGSGTIVNIIDTSKNVQETLAQLRKLMRDWSVEDYEPVPGEDGRSYAIRYLRGKVWTEVSSTLQPTKAQNLRAVYWAIHNLKTWGERGITGLAGGVTFVGGLVPTGRGGDRESFDEACDILGVDHDAPVEEVKRIYQVKVQRHHPDHGGDPERFKRLQKAYDLVLKVKGEK